MALHTLQHSRRELGPSSALHAKERGFSSTWKRLTQPKAPAGLALSPPQLLLPLHRPVAAHSWHLCAHTDSWDWECSFLLLHCAHIHEKGSCFRQMSPATSWEQQPPASGGPKDAGRVQQADGHSRSCVLHLHCKERAQRAPAVGQDKESRKMDRTWPCVLTPGKPPVLG